jgi:hypothetical protein
MVHDYRALGKSLKMRGNAESQSKRDVLDAAPLSNVFFDRLSEDIEKGLDQVAEGMGLPREQVWERQNTAATSASFRIRASTLVVSTTLEGGAALLRWMVTGSTEPPIYKDAQIVADGPQRVLKADMDGERKSTADVAYFLIERLVSSA